METRDSRNPWWRKGGVTGRGVYGTSRFLIVEVKNVLEDLEFFIFVCDDSEVEFRETL